MGSSLCCPAAQHQFSRGVEKSKQIKIYGDYFSSNTRALLAICHMAQIDFEFVIVDTFNQDHRRKPYFDLNPSSTIPMITHGTTRIFGDNESLFFFLINSFERVAALFFPLAQVEQITVLLEWIQDVALKYQGKLIRQALLPRNSVTVDDALQAALSDYCRQVLTQLEIQLGEDQYLTGSQMSLIDIIVYSDLSTVIKLFKHKVQIDRYKNLSQWIKQIGGDETLRSLDYELELVINQYNLIS